MSADVFCNDKESDRQNIEVIEGIGIERDLAGLPVVTIPAKVITGQDEDVPAWLRQHTVCAAGAGLFPEPPRFVPAVGDDRLRDNLRRVIEYARSKDAEMCYQVLIRWFD